jgi:RecB family exonuclease
LASGDHSLLSDADVSDLIAAGVPLPARADRSRDEMLLFYQSLTRPRRGLFLSYAALDAKAQPLMPSPYLQELAKLCGDRWPKAGPLDLSPLPTCAEPMCERDLRLLAVAGGVDGNVSLLAELLRGPGGSIPAPAGAAFADRVAVGQAAPAMPGKPSPRATARASSKKVARQTPSDPRRALADNLRQGLLAHDERRGPAFGAFDGLLLSDRARATLSARFGPASLWSASQLEQYVTCPFEFFLSRILRLEPLEELELSADYLRRGRALHGALAGLHRRVNERAGRPAALGDAAQTLADAAELLAELCKSRADEPPLERALREIDRRVLETALGAYHEQQEKYEKQLRSSDERLLPAHFEVSFGSPLRTAAANAAGTSAAGDEALPEAAEAVDLLSTAEPYRFDCGEETVLLRGRIDRIDVAKIDDRVVFSVLDYKSGRAGRLGKNAVSQGLALQLPLYALAASDLLLPGADAALLHGGYWFLKGSGYAAALEGHEIDRGSVAATDEWLQLRKDLAGWVLAAVRSVRNGQFPVASRDDECTGRCPYRTVCRVNQVRSLHKIWPPPAEPPRPDA